MVMVASQDKSSLRLWSHQQSWSCNELRRFVQKWGDCSKKREHRWTRFLPISPMARSCRGSPSAPSSPHWSHPCPKMTSMACGTRLTKIVTGVSRARSSRRLWLQLFRRQLPCRRRGLTSPTRCGQPLQRLRLCELLECLAEARLCIKRSGSSWRPSMRRDRALWTASLLPRPYGLTARPCRMQPWRCYASRFAMLTAWCSSRSW
mmetsp:Transcript_18228/g.42677  ORF Transcript_18228/g.42677 Transcript_18228/m.42677 type:complete len:205 (-) Transcript_18228:51-665(-)